MPKDNLASWTPGTSLISGIQIYHTLEKGEVEDSLTISAGNFSDDGGDSIYIKWKRKMYTV
ncbi:hypothetical protein FHR24_000141 [Wenyingzhuangia heitensis]|uniref:Uncharacterized protein n=1 Tax=Wenyingzhuangia heitensis TaxID=1487859 RepID=A0ABX0U4A8_9FLAO|nr:hypothetical protein [Wenyingzhuangia heitensis]NIJ43702.1 hypothetical protein [Wenyingzhuangia heitensis]